MTAGVPKAGVRHGTIAGRQRHSELGELPCVPCFEAKKRYDERLGMKDERKLRNQIRARAQARAITRLTKLHYEEFQELFREEKAAAADELDRVHQEHLA